MERGGMLPVSRKQGGVRYKGLRHPNNNKRILENNNKRAIFLFVDNFYV
jgi:hypothetical protein